MSEATIQTLYSALDRHDGEAAAACYTDDAVFEDPAFGRLTGGAVKNMWRMLAERSADLSVRLGDHGVAADGRTGVTTVIAVALPSTFATAYAPVSARE